MKQRLTPIYSRIESKFRTYFFIKILRRQWHVLIDRPIKVYVSVEIFVFLLCQVFFSVTIISFLKLQCCSVEVISIESCVIFEQTKTVSGKRKDSSDLDRHMKQQNKIAKKKKIYMIINGNVIADESSGIGVDEIHFKN